MRAIAQSKYGGPETLQLVDLPMPAPGPGELLVKVHACGVNPVDFKVRKGLVPLPHAFPLVLGYDVSGVVEEVGKGVEDFEPGDAVFYAPELLPPGGYAEYHVVHEGIVAAKPDELTHVEAASLPLAGCTAWQALFDRACVEAGDLVLIHGAAGGVGSLAVQMAIWAGCEVVGTASAENHDLLERFGVDMAIDYRSQDFVKEILEATDGEGVDAVIDTVGGGVFVKSFEALAPHGCVVSIAPEAMKGFGLDALVPAFFKNAEAHFHFFQRDRATLDSVARMVERGFIEAIVDEVLPLEDAAKAHARLETCHGRGKVVLEVVEE